MRKITKREIQIGLNQLVDIKFLVEKDGKYKYHPEYKEILLKSEGETKEEKLLDALYRANYFQKARTEREILVVINLLLLKNGN